MFHIDSTSVDSPQSDSCLKVLLFLTYRGPAERSWSVLNATLNYSATPELLAGQPRAYLTGFRGDRSDTIELGPCPPGFFVSEALGAENESPYESRLDGEALLSVEVNSQTGRIQLDGVSRTELLITRPGRSVPYAVVVFPLKARTNGSLELRFVPDSIVKDGNLLADTSGHSLTAYTLDSQILISPSRSLFVWRFWTFAITFLLAFICRYRRL